MKQSVKCENRVENNQNKLSKLQAALSGNTALTDILSGVCFLDKLQVSGLLPVNFLNVAYGEVKRLL